MKYTIVMVIVFGSLLSGSIQNSKFTFMPQSAAACDYCLLTQGLSPLETTHGFGFRLDGRYTVLNSKFSGSDKIENHEGEKETHFTTQITAFYNLTERFTLIGILPVPRRSVSLHAEDADDREEDMHGDDAIHSHNANGSSFNVGDLNIMGRYTFFSKQRCWRCKPELRFLPAQPVNWTIAMNSLTPIFNRERVPGIFWPGWHLI